MKTMVLQFNINAEGLEIPQKEVPALIGAALMYAKGKASPQGKEFLHRMAVSAQFAEVITFNEAAKIKL